MGRHRNPDVGLVAHQRLSELEPRERALHAIVRRLHQIGETPDIEFLAQVVLAWPVYRVAGEISAAELHTAP